MLRGGKGGGRERGGMEKEKEGRVMLWREMTSINMPMIKHQVIMVRRTGKLARGARYLYK